MQKTLYNIQFYFGKIVLFFLELPIHFISKNKEIIATSAFSWISEIEERFDQIQHEVFDVITFDKTLDVTYFSTEQFKVTAPDFWSVFPLITFGNVIQENVERCPETYKALQQIPNCTTAFFSILKPNAKVARHRGIYKGYLRYHLGIKTAVNYTDCGLVFDNITYHWKEKESVVFDDTFYHSVYNNSEDIRIVLYVDFIRPLPQPMLFMAKQINELIRNSKYIKNLKTK